MPDSDTRLAVPAATLLVAFLGWTQAPPAHAQAPGGAHPVVEELPLPDGAPFVPGQILVRYADEAGAAMEILPEGSRVEPTSGGEILLQLAVPEGIDAAPRFSGPDGADDAASELAALTLSEARRLDALPTVEYAIPNYLMFPHVTTPNDPLYPRQWHYRESSGHPGGIDLPNEWNTSVGDSGVVVAVLDTGILPSHPEIVDSTHVVDGYDMISDAWRANDGDGRDADPTDAGDATAPGECGPRARRNSWHGTHVSGTVGVGTTDDGAGMAGVVWKARVQAVRVLGRCGGTLADIADAIRWAAGMSVPGVPDNQTPADVINMSLGGRGACSPVYQRAIDDAVARGTVVVVSAGNSASDASGYRPASCRRVISVAASDGRGHLARYSNFGSDVTLMAPGGDVRRDDDGDGFKDGVLSMVHPSDGTYAYYNGTSMAAPHVAGVAALFLAREPNLTPAELETKLTQHVRARDASHGCGGDRCGAGLLTLAAASPPPPASALPLPGFLVGASAALLLARAGSTWRRPRSRSSA